VNAGWKEEEDEKFPLVFPLKINSIAFFTSKKFKAF
jgi:hypothetical protein